VHATPPPVHARKISSAWSVCSNQTRAYFHHLALLFQHAPQHSLPPMSPYPENPHPPPAMQTPMPLMANQYMQISWGSCARRDSASPSKLEVPESNSDQQSKRTSPLPAEPTIQQACYSSATERHPNIRVAPSIPMITEAKAIRPIGKSRCPRTPSPPPPSSAPLTSFLSSAYTQCLPFSFPHRTQRLLSRERLCGDEHHDLDDDKLYLLRELQDRGG